MEEIRIQSDSIACVRKKNRAKGANAPFGRGFFLLKYARHKGGACPRPKCNPPSIYQGGNMVKKICSGGNFFSKIRGFRNLLGYIGG
jgi:hypothetical protein